MEYTFPPPRVLELRAGEDWRFVLPDVRDASGHALDLNGYRLRLQFRPASLHGFLIADLQEGAGITVSAPIDAEHGPTITLLSRACGRTWFPMIDTPVVGDLMMFRGNAPDKDSIFLQRVAFTATWGVTRDG